MTQVNLENFGKVSMVDVDKPLRELLYDILVRLDQIEKQNQPVQENEKSEEPIVVYRYIRPLNWMGEVQSDQGITLRFDLDYKNERVEVHYAICDGDNFSKKVGRTIVDERASKFSSLWFDMRTNPDFRNQPLMKSLCQACGIVSGVTNYPWCINGTQIPHWVYQILKKELLKHL